MDLELLFHVDLFACDTGREKSMNVFVESKCEPETEVNNTKIVSHRHGSTLVSYLVVRGLALQQPSGSLIWVEFSATSVPIPAESMQDFRDESTADVLK